MALLAAVSLVGYALLPGSLRGRRSELAIPLSVSIGAGAAGLAVWLAGSLAGTRSVLPLLAVAVLVSLQRARAFAGDLCRVGRRLAALSRRAPVLSVLLVAAALTPLPQLLLPLVDSDGVRYHVALPKLFVLTGRVFFYPWSVHAALPQGTEMLYLAGLLLRSGETAKWLHYGFFLATLAGLALAVHRGKGLRQAALVAPLLYATSPAVAAVAPAAFVDHAVAFHVVVATLCVARGRLAGASFALGAALAAKPTAGPAALGLLGAAVVRAPRGRRLVTAGLFLCGTVAFVLPLSVRNLLATGDPVYPVGHVLVGAPVPGVSEESQRKTTRWTEGGGGGPVGIAWFPGPGLRAEDAAGGHLLAVLAGAPLLLRRRGARPFLAVGGATLGVALFLSPPAWYLLPLFASLAACGGLLAASLRRPWGALVAGLLVAPGLVTTARAGLESFSPVPLLTGRVSREEFLERAVPGYRAAALLRRFEGEAVMAVDFPAPYYLDRPWVAEGLLDEPVLRSWMRETDSADDLLLRLRLLRVRHLLVTPGYGGGSSVSMLPLAPVPEKVPLAAALRSRLRLLGSVDGVDLYEVPDAGRLGP